jgi:polar amino acid transport system substrate-binding protein
MDAGLNPTGSDVETAKMIAKSLDAELDLVQITNAARVPTIQTRKADILIASLAITPERKRAIDFTIPYATLDIIVAGIPSLAVKDYAGPRRQAHRRDARHRQRRHGHAECPWRRDHPLRG